MALSVRSGSRPVKTFFGRPRDDEGAALILVLAFLLVISLIIPVLLNQASTNLATQVGTRQRANSSYDADGALQTAVNTLRSSAYNNALGQQCFLDPSSASGESNTLQVASLNGAGKAAVLCTPGAGTGAQSTVVPVSSANKPGLALLALPQAGEEGLVQTGNNVFRIHGKVYVGGALDVQNPNASLVDDSSPVYASGACPGKGKVIGQPAICNDTAHSSLATDPGYASALPSVPAYQATPICPNKASTITLSPGYYDNAAALSALTSNSCKGSLLWFKPGAYYFDFHDSGSHLWDISSGYVVGGTAVGQPAGSPPPLPPTIPGACVSPLSSQTNGGVQFVFGNDSRVSISNGAQMELCGQYSRTSPPIVLYGMPTGTDETVSDSGRLLTDGSGAKVGNDITFANPTRITQKDAPVAPTACGLACPQTSDANLTATGNSTPAASVKVSGFTASIPAGSTLVSAKLYVSHRDLIPASGGGPITALASTLTPVGGTALTPSNTVTPGSTDSVSTPVHEESWDYTTALASLVHDSGFTGAAATFTATGTKGKSTTEQLDSLQLQLTYKLPKFRAQTLSGSCVGIAPYGTNNGSCAFLKATGPSTALYLQGTTYVPKAALDITLNNISQQVFRYGLVVRTLTFSITGSSSFDQAVISIPEDSTDLQIHPVAIYLQVYLCPGDACSGAPGTDPGWIRRASARVDIQDSTPGIAAPPHRQVLLQQWSALR